MSHELLSCNDVNKSIVVVTVNTAFEIMKRLLVKFSKKQTKILLLHVDCETLYKFV